MPRAARLRAPGFPLHIVQRGHNGCRCFHFDGDYERYLDILLNAAEAYQCRIHAFVLMTNHVHLLATPDDPDGPSRMMKRVAQRHAQTLNRREERTGSFWSDRFYSSIVQSDRYLLACHRYIEMNPVRARMVRRPERYRWSSYRANAFGEESNLIVPHSLYLELGTRPETRQRAYRALFADDLDSETLGKIREATRCSRAVGDERFHKRLGQELGVCTFARRPGRPAKTGTVPVSGKTGTVPVSDRMPR